MPPVYDLNDPWQRKKAKIWVFLHDHGIFRSLFYSNFHQIAPHAFRSSQPSPAQLRRAVARHNIKTVVNLRGYNLEEPHLKLEHAACQELGIAMENFCLRSRDAPTKEELHQAYDLMQRITYPALFHCKSGADRAGLFSALYMHWMENQPMEQAAKQLRLWPFGHIRQGKPGVLDHFLACYLAETKDQPMAFLDWVDDRYDRQAVLDSFTPLLAFDLLIDKILRRE